MRAGPRWVALTALLLAVSACSTVPTSSPTVQITQAPSRAAEVVGIEPLPPVPGAPPEEIVRSFIDAAASTRAGHPVAREYLTPEAAGSWSDEGAITVLVTHRFSTVAAADLVVVLADGRVSEVGSHASLMAAGGGYAELYGLQARGYA